MSAPSDDVKRVSLVCARHDASVPAARAIGAITEEWQEKRIAKKLPILQIRHVRRAKISNLDEMYLNRGFTINFSSEHDYITTNILIAEIASKLQEALKIDYLLIFDNNDKTTLRPYLFSELPPSIPGN